MEKIVLIGAGNLAFHLGQCLHQAGIEVIQVYSRKITKARKLSKLIQSTAINRLEQLSPEGDLYILAVSDTAIGEVAQRIAAVIPSDKLVVHTSGATPSTVLKNDFKRYGIFYPLQSFSISRKVDFQQLPICIDAYRKRDQKILTKLAKRISSNVHFITDEQRAILHVAAVFVNNFSNHLFNIGAQISQQEGLDFDLLKPLILETVAKIQDSAPEKMQTGPAIRGDQLTLKRHLEYLEKFPQYAAIYQLMSHSINPKLKKEI